MNGKASASCLLIALALAMPCDAQDESSLEQPLFVDKSALEPERVQRVKEQLERLLPALTVKTENVARSMYPLAQPTRYLVVKWEAYVDAPDMICFTDIEKYKKGSKVEIVKEERRREGGWAGARFLAKEALRLFGVAVGHDGELLWWGELNTARIIHPAIPLPGTMNVCAEMHITKPEMLIEMPDDRRIKELRIYENSGTGGGWDEVGRIAL